ncbi:AraC family transcriptional regulator [Phenylobacterium sp. LjRoot225]|uniref:AraC family transcriptional regulator n=1 Tax=Phenylobacterium sp. LjRoot225 TaxID=3342285 RepID=UPI003ECF8A12
MAKTSSAEPQSEAGQRFDVVHAKMLQFFPDLVEQLGGDPQQLAAQVGIDAAHPGEPGSKVTYRQVLDLLECAAETLPCPDFGMRLARLQGGRMFGPLGVVMKNSQTFGEALDYVSQHAAAHSLAARIWLAGPRRHGAVFAGHDILLDHAPHKAQAMEQILLVGHLSAMEMTGGGARARKVYFRHQPISSPKVYRRYFGCEVLFGQHVDGVVYSERDLAAPIVTPDARAYAAATSFIDTEFSGCRVPLHAQARGVIMQYLGTDLCRNERIAAELSLHPQTMLRRLKAEGASFQKIKDDVRRDLMIYYIQGTDLDFASISERLGFAEQSVMTRTCNRWFSASPTRLRSAARSPHPAG